MTSDYLKPIPRPNEVSKTYWHGTARREILLQKCKDCDNIQYYPRPLCTKCFSQDLSWIRASGRGTVHTFSVIYQNIQPGFVDELPYVLVVVELEEGPRMTTNILNCAPQDVYIGMPVEMTFQYITPEVWLPQFKPRASGSMKRRSKK